MMINEMLKNMSRLLDKMHGWMQLYNYIFGFQCARSCSSNFVFIISRQIVGFMCGYTNKIQEGHQRELQSKVLDLKLRPDPTQGNVLIILCLFCSKVGL